MAAYENIELNAGQEHVQNFWWPTAVPNVSTGLPGAGPPGNDIGESVPPVTPPTLPPTLYPFGLFA